MSLLKVKTFFYLENSSDVVSGERSEETVSAVGADKPPVVALLQNVDDVTFSNLQLVRVHGPVVEHCAISKKVCRH